MSGRADSGDVDAVLSVGELAILASAGGLGKSCLTLAVEAATAAEAGREYGNAGGAVLVSYEDSLAGTIIQMPTGWHLSITAVLIGRILYSCKNDNLQESGSKQLMVKGLVVHRSDEGQKCNPYDYIRPVSFDGVDFGWVCRDGWPDEIKWSFMYLDVCEDGNLREIECEKEYDSLSEIRADLMRKIQAKQAKLKADRRP